MDRIRVLVADDHPVFLDGLCAFLSHAGADLEIVGTASNGEEAVDLEQKRSPDIVLLDIKMPRMDGIEALRLIRGRRPDAKVIMLTTFDETDLVRDAIEGGAKGYLLKEATVEEIIEAIRMVSKGQLLMSGRAAERLSRVGVAPAGGTKRSPGAADADAAVDASRLSQRERQIIRLVARGETNKEIASHLFISEKTVRNHVSHMYEILNLHERTRMALWAMRNGLS